MKLLRETIKRMILESQSIFLDTLKTSFDTWDGHRFTKYFPDGCYVYVEIKLIDETTYHIGMIETIGNNCNRKGYASQVMESVISIATAHGITLTLDVASYPGGPSEEQLEDWYWNMGFEKTDDGMILREGMTLDRSVNGAQQMVRELANLSIGHPPQNDFDIEIVLDHGGCLSIITMEIDSPQSIWLNNIYTTDSSGRQSSRCYQKGHASKAMDIITGLADKYNVTLDLIAAPPSHMVRNDPNLPNADQLAKFYARFGFVETKRNIKQVYMTRTP
jgi:hypothetical protein